MNWQFEIMREQVLPIYQQLDGLASAIFVGSASRNMQGAYSDVDMVIYWTDRFPEDPIRQDAIETAGGVIGEIGDTSEGETDPALQSRGEAFYLFGDRHTGAKIDVTHKTINSAERLIQDVVRGHTINRIKLSIIHSMQRSITLYGETWMDGCREQIGQECPMEIADALIRQNIKLNPLWVFDMFADRPDLILDLRFRLQLVEQMLMILVGLNRLYPPHYFKHLNALVEELAIKPENLTDRIQRILKSEPANAKQVAVMLGDEVYDLVHQYRPAIEVGSAREFFHFSRPKHEQSPLVKG